MVIGGLLTVIALNVQLRDPAADRQWSPMTDHCPALHWGKHKQRAKQDSHTAENNKAVTLCAGPGLRGWWIWLHRLRQSIKWQGDVLVTQI